MEGIKHEMAEKAISLLLQNDFGNTQKAGYVPLPSTGSYQKCSFLFLAHWKTVCVEKRIFQLLQLAALESFWSHPFFWLLNAQQTGTSSLVTPKCRNGFGLQQWKSRTHTEPEDTAVANLRATSHHTTVWECSSLPVKLHTPSNWASVKQDFNQGLLDLSHTASLGWRLFLLLLWMQNCHQPKPQAVTRFPPPPHEIPHPLFMRKKLGVQTGS